MKITENKNWYLVWIAALLLLTLGKVYEWAYPGFEHDFNHFLRNRIESEIAAFESGTHKAKAALQQQIKKENGSRTDWTILQHFLVGSQEHHVICSNQQIRFWSGGQAFYDPHWCLEEDHKPLKIFQHYGNYYLQSMQSVLLDSSWYQWIQVAPIRSANQSREVFEIVNRKSGDSKLLIRDSKNETLGYLQMDAPFLAPYYGNILIVYYVLVLLLFYLPFHRIARNFYAEKNFPWANLILISGVLVTASMCQWIVHQNEFYHSILTDKLIHTRFYHYTLFEFSVFSGIFFHITYFFYKYARLAAHKTEGWFATAIVLANYLASIFSLVIYCFIFNAVFIHSDYYFDLNNVFSFTLQHYILLFDLLIILVAIFLITNKLTLSTNTFGFSLQKRLAFYLIACIAITPLIYQSNIEIGLVSFFLGATIIIWMQDFFSEDYQKNILWLISWIIVISILNSSLIFHYQNQKKRYVKNQLVSQYLDCEGRQQPECLANLIQNCSTNYFDLYYFEDHLLKFSSNVFKPGYEQSLKYLRQDTIRHVIQEGRDVLYHKPNPTRLLVISNPLESTLKGVSLFSYLFTILIVISYLLSLVHQKLQFLPADLQITFQDKPSLKNRIQFYVILGIVISFLIIALTTVFFTRRSENQIFRENLISKSKNLCAFLESGIEHAPQMDDAKTILMTQLRQSSLMVDFTVKLYDAGGKEEKVFDSPLTRSGIQGLLDPQFYFRYPAFAEDVVVLERRQPETTFNAYRNIFFNNQRIGILEVEAIASQQYKSTDRLANLINTLLNIYVFLFLIAASLATLLANSITSPLVNLGEKIRQIRLGKTNEKLEWSGQDEIGELIGNYNQMVGQLDESAQLLAKSERDSAWREMAKQVAHEIKNPLTPMKLSIQYLQQSIRSGSDDIREMAEKVSHTLIEQIDNLTKIATEFSNFAKMPQAENEKLILNEIVSSVHDLFRKREDLDILLSVPIDELFVFADKNQVIRVLNNLINNAIQAIPETRRGRIEISLDSNVRNAVICVTDNGTGIPEELQSKVFLPNFTSKSSGTGLGLAMCQQIIESSNGRIYFRTVPGKGTSFYIELPLMRIPLPEEPDESQ